MFFFASIYMAPKSWRGCFHMTPDVEVSVESDRVAIANASKKPRGFSLKGSICTCGQQRPFDVSQIRFRFLEALSCY